MLGRRLSSFLGGALKAKRTKLSRTFYAKDQKSRDLQTISGQLPTARKCHINWKKRSVSAHGANLAHLIGVNGGNRDRFDPITLCGWRPSKLPGQTALSLDLRKR